MPNQSTKLTLPTAVCSIHLLLLSLFLEHINRNIKYGSHWLAKISWTMNNPDTVLCIRNFGQRTFVISDPVPWPVVPILAIAVTRVDRRDENDGLTIISSSFSPSIPSARSEISFDLCNGNADMYSCGQSNQNLSRSDSIWQKIFHVASKVKVKFESLESSNPRHVSLTLHLALALYFHIRVTAAKNCR